MRLKSTLLVCVLLMIALQGVGQISIFSKYNQNQIDWQDDWQRMISPDVLYGKSYTIGVAYWFRLKKHRVEFHPGAYISVSNQMISPYSSGLGVPKRTFAEQNGYGVEVPIHIYFLDWREDSKKPTYSKEGTFLAKGLHAFITPGYRRLVYGFIGYDDEYFNPTLDTLDRQHLFTVASGVGLDIGVGDLFTITPFGGVEYVPNLQWDALNNFIETSSSPGGSGQDNLLSLVAGLRLTLRADYVRNEKIGDLGY